MKILYHHRVASKDGQYVHVAEIVAALRELGHEVIVSEPGSTQSKSFGNSSDAVSNIRKYLPNFIHEFAEFAYSFFDFIKVVRLIQVHRPDGIYERYNLFFPSGIWAKKIFKIPLILEINAPLYEERSTHGELSLKRLAEWSESYVWRNADFVLPVTGVLAKRVLARGVHTEKLQVIHNGINRKQFSELISDVSVREKHGLQEQLILGFTGFAREWHGIDRVLDFLAEHREQNWHLMLVGDGPVTTKLNLQARKLGIDDKFTVTGIVSREEIPEYVASFDIALQPDVVDYASPLKLFEYMALGKAIIAPDSPNIREVITDGVNGLLFDPTNPTSFDDKLAVLCVDGALRSRFSEDVKQALCEGEYFWDSNAENIAFPD